MDMYVYADETSFKKNSDSTLQTIGTGVLISHSPVDDKIITDALTKLSNDPDKNKYDEKTLQNGFFHASNDSKNGRSFICSAISTNIHGVFKYSYFHKEKLISLDTSRSDEDYNRLTLGLSSLDIHTYKCDKVHLHIENRSGFSEQSANEWKENWLKELDKHAYTQTNYITYYPDIKIYLCTKKTAGLQVVDFILWACNKSTENPPDKTWLDRISYNCHVQSTAIDWPQDGGQMFLGNEIDFPETLYEYPIVIDKSLNPNDYTKFWDFIIKSITDLGNSSIDQNIIHLKDRIDLAHTVSKKTVLTELDARTIASAFIRVFDTLPLYKNLSKDHEVGWTWLLKAKKLAGLLMRPELQEYRKCFQTLKRHTETK